MLQRLMIALMLHVGRLRDEEEGFSTAELLGNAALGVLALVAIWVLLKALGQDVVKMIRNQIMGQP